MESIKWGMEKLYGNVTETSSFLIQYATAGPSVFVLYPNDVRAHCPCHEIPTMGLNNFWIKGQLISKCPFVVTKSTKKPTKHYSDFKRYFHNFLCINFKYRLCKNVTSESIWPHCDNSHAMVCKNGPSTCFCYFPGFSRVYRGKGEYTCIFSRTIWTLKNKNL